MKLAAILVGVFWLSSVAVAAPPTPRREVKTVLHGITIREDYRWLEDLKDPEVQTWLDAQNGYTRTWLDNSKGIAQVRDRVRAIETYSAPAYSLRAWRKDRWFAVKRQPPRQQPLVVTLSSLDDLTTERVALDPNEIDPTGATSIDWFVPSLDGRLLAASLSKNGSEVGALHLFDLATGKPLTDVIPGVQVVGASGSCAFTADGSGVYYTRHPAQGERPAADHDFFQQVWFHKLGTPVEKDHYVIGKEFPRIAEVHLTSSDDGRWLLAHVANGDGGEIAFWLQDPAGAWTQLTRFEDRVVQARFGHDSALYLLSRDHALRGKILRVPLSEPRLSAAQTVAPEGTGAIEEFGVTATQLFIVELDGGPNRVRILSLDGKPQPPISVLPVASVGGLISGRGNELAFWQESFVSTQAWYRLVDGKVLPTRLKRKSLVDFADSEVLRETAISKDGTRVPFTIIRKKGTRLDGNNPTLLNGYGGYGISSTPFFGQGMRVFVEQGGVYVIANLRGGGEFGDAWHEAGKLTHKQNVFDDFVAVANQLIAEKLTRPARLAILGGSNGGLLMGAATTQHPELFRAVVCSRGILDMIRFERIPNGQFNVTEFGSVSDPVQFKALYAYSPYHHVVDGTRYPSVLLLTGTHDGRVAPSDSFKMAARLQAANRGDGVILLRTSDKSGHGMGSALDERIAESVDMWTFVFRELGVDYHPVATEARR